MKKTIFTIKQDKISVLTRYNFGFQVTEAYECGLIPRILNIYKDFLNLEDAVFYKDGQGKECLQLIIEEKSSNSCTY